MSEIEKIKRYIERTNIRPNLEYRYCMCWDDMAALLAQAEVSRFSAIDQAFKYGQAKGYRAAKAEARK